MSITPEEYESRRKSLASAFDAENERMEKNLREWNRIKILEAAANQVADSNARYLRCVLSARSRDVLERDCESALDSHLGVLNGARQAVAKSVTLSTEKRGIHAAFLDKIEKRDGDALRQQAEALEEQVSLHALTVICDGVSNLRAETLSTYLSALSAEKYRTALRTSAQSKRLYSVGRLLARSCSDFANSAQLREIEFAAVGIAFAEAMFEPKLLAAAACTSPVERSIDRQSLETLGRMCSDLLYGVTEADVKEFRSWLTAFSAAVQQTSCREWIEGEFLKDPSPLDSLRYSGLARRVNNTPCNFPPVPPSFQTNHVQGLDFRFPLSTILGLLGDRDEK